jgi:hypothetical protein
MLLEFLGLVAICLLIVVVFVAMGIASNALDREI